MISLPEHLKHILQCYDIGILVLGQRQIGISQALQVTRIGLTHAMHEDDVH